MSPATPATTPSNPGGLTPIAERYNAMLCDVWGVLYNGVRIFPEAQDALALWRERGGKTVLLSNSPRRSAVMQQQLTGKGLAPTLYDGIITSGEASWQFLRANDPRLPPPYYYIGPKNTGLEQELLDGVARASSISQAGSIVIAGAEGDHWGTQVQKDDLSQALTRQLPALCTNPDLQVRRGENLEPCAGLVAQAYGEKGGQVIYVGKPHPLVYEMALALLEKHATKQDAKQGENRVLAVGDGLPTDIRGAALAGCDSLLIRKGGIHEVAALAHPDGVEGGWQALYHAAGATPTWILDHFTR